MRETSSRHTGAGHLYTAGDAAAGPEPARWRVTPQLAVGLLVMALGVMLTLDRLGILDFGRTARFWPLALVVLGVTLWAGDRGARGRFWGTTWIVIGSWLLLNTLGWVTVGFWDLFWPLVLVLVGLKLILHTSRPWRGTPIARGEASLFAMMGGCKRSVDDTPFRRGQITAIMGGCILDLRRAVVTPGEEPVIEVFALMGGIELWVPGDWSVASDDVVPVMGGVEDKRLPPLPPAADAAPAAPPARLRVRGHVVMGGLVIKN